MYFIKFFHFIFRYTAEPADTTTTTPAPEGVDEPTVEGSDNNTKTLKGKCKLSLFGKGQSLCFLKFKENL